MSFIKLENVCKQYEVGDYIINAANKVSFDIEQGEFCAVVGPSGAGKTTVLSILGGMDTCDSGRVIVDGKDVAGFNRSKMIQYRRHEVGFIFQFYNLIQNLTALENVELAAQISRHPLSSMEMLKLVGLADRANNFPAQLSGGEQQRVAIARALAKNPKLLLCDEPTGALDYATGISILKLLQDTSRETDMTVVLITHNQAITPMADRVVTMRSGKVHRIEINETPMPVERIEW